MSTAADLIRDHRLGQIDIGASVALLVLALGEEYRKGGLSRDEFVEALVTADLLAHNEAVALAAAFVADLRAAEGVASGVVVEVQFDIGRSYGRAIGTRGDLDELRQVARDFDGEFRRIVEHLAVRADREAKGSGRETVMASAETASRGWRRVSDGNPCSFCAMLIARGPAYTSEEAALTVVGVQRRGRKSSRARRRGRTRGSRGLGEKFHTNCGCTTVEVFGEWTPTAEEQRLVDLYDEAVAQCEADGVPANAKNIQARMRAAGHGVINDAHVPDTKDRGPLQTEPLTPAERRDQRLVRDGHRRGSDAA